MSYNESLFLSTEHFEYPYHSLNVYQIGISSDKFIDFDENDIEVIDTVDEGNFKAYRTYNSHDSFSENTTYAYYDDGQYEYQLVSHKNCAYDDVQFKKDVNLLRNVAHSIVRK